MPLGLKEYQNKRDFRRTGEPQGEVRDSESRRLFTIQKHAARRLHYDLRLEFGGVLKSWAVPKGPSLDPAEKRLAVHVEDHPVAYASFEGIIPDGEYGGGTVMVWDQGEWEPIGDPHKDYPKGKLKFALHGKKLRGVWTLAQMHGEKSDRGKNWLLIKHRDETARPEKEYRIVEDRQESALTGRDMSAIANQANAVWTNEGLVRREARGGRNNARQAQTKSSDSHAFEVSSITDAHRADAPTEITPQMATLANEPPAGADWVHEIKYDGYRLLSIKHNDSVRMITRRGNDWTDRFKSLAKTIAGLPVQSAILDGEAVVQTPEGRTDFQALQNQLTGIKSGSLIYYAFDLIYCNGYDLSTSPLIERKELLRRIMEASNHAQNAKVRFSDHIVGSGADVYAQACKLGLEGIVSKRAAGPYQQRRTRNWLKIKCLHRQEFVIGGFSEPGGSRTHFGALVLGYYDEAGKLSYAGRVGTGFNEAMLRELGGRLKNMEAAKTPFHRPPTGLDAKGVHWVEPSLVAEVEFSEWTSEGILRQASFKGLREDKSPHEVVRELTPAENQSLNTKKRDEAASGRTPSAARTRTTRTRKGSMRIDSVSLTNPLRVLYPDIDLTKQEFAEYSAHIAEWILPYIRQRPLSLVRCPNGIAEGCFYQKHISEGLPGQLKTISIQEKGDAEKYLFVNDRAGLLALSQLAVLEIHPWGSRNEALESPDMMVFDLDPGPGISWQDIIDATFAVRGLLTATGLESFVKTSGGKGLHVVIPLEPVHTWDEVKGFARSVALKLEREQPRRFVSSMSKSKRRGKIFLDYVRNSRGSTTVAPYSPRARAGAPVSMPIAWDALSPAVKPDGFTIRNAPEQLRSRTNDPWAEYFSVAQRITDTMRSHILSR